MHNKSYKTKTSIAKKVISWTVGIPAAVIAVSEINDLNYWWMPFAAIGLIVLILKWNRMFDDKEEYQPKFVNRRRSF